MKRDRRTFLRKGLGSAAAATAVAALPGSAKAKKMPVQKKVVRKPGEQPSPSPLFSSGIQFGRLIFVAGQGAHDPQTHKVVEGPFPNQVRQCLENVKSVLEAAGSSMDKALKVTVFLTDIGNFQAMNEVYHTYFTKEPPVRTTVAVKELPGDSPIEIDCFAYVDREE